MLLDRISEITESIIRVENTIGFWKVLRYVFLGLFIIALFNFKTVVKVGIEFVNEISNEIHDEKMEKRDQLLSELFPVLKEYRASVGADRVLYFEYHNSKENLVGIPFKYIDIVLQDTRYGVPTLLDAEFKDINVGSITTLYEDIKNGDLIECDGENDIYFQNKYRGTYDIFNDSSIEKLKQVYLSIPGIRQPVGMVVLEWIDNNGEASVDMEKVKSETVQFRPRINAIIMSKR